MVANASIKCGHRYEIQNEMLTQIQMRRGRKYKMRCYHKYKMRCGRKYEMRCCHKYKMRCGRKYEMRCCHKYKMRWDTNASWTDMVSCML